MLLPPLGLFTSYYKSVEWLVEFAKKNKLKKIFIKHHPSWKEDDIELELLKDIFH